MPQALLFDEGYHSHSFYQFEVVEDWLAAADVLVFVGTSLPAVVQLTAVALRHARQAELPVFNFNIYPYTQDHSLNVTNIVGPAAETLPLFLAVCQEMRIEENPSSNEYRRKLRRR